MLGQNEGAQMSVVFPYGYSRQVRVQAVVSHGAHEQRVAAEGRRLHVMAAGHA
jgi:hypothetical protein